MCGLNLWFVKYRLFSSSFSCVRACVLEGLSARASRGGRHLARVLSLDARAQID